MTRTRFWYKVCIWKGTQRRGWQTNFLRNLTKRGVNKLFKKLRDTGTVNRWPHSAALKKTLSFFFRSSRSLPLTLFCRSSGAVTKNTFLSVKKTKSLAYCGNFWSRSLARFMRAAQFASVCQLLCTAPLERFQMQVLTNNLGYRRPMNIRLPWYLTDSPVGLRLVLLTQD